MKAILSTLLVSGWALLAVPPAVGQVFVDADATGANTGTTWLDAYTSLQSALFSAMAGDEIWVAEGTYTPSSSGNRYASFDVQDQVALYGGFNATETLREQRDWVAHPTILSGDIGAPDSTDNSYHVVFSDNAGPSTRLDGFTVTGGYADSVSVTGSSNYDHGAGLWLVSSDMTIANVIVERNTALDDGAGMYLKNASPAIVDVVIRNNRTGRVETYSEYGDGGGVYAYNSNATFTNVTITGNYAEFLGFDSDGMYINGGSIAMTDCLIDANARSGIGGESISTFTRVTFSNHSRLGIECEDRCVFNDCTFNNNNSALYVQKDSELNDCLFVGNTGYAFTTGSGFIEPGQAVVLNNVTFLDNGVSIRAVRANIEINNCRVIGSTSYAIVFDAEGYPPGDHLSKMTNCAIIYNQSTALYIESGTHNFTNITVANNVLGGGGSAIVCYECLGTVSNSIFWDNGPDPIVTHDSNDLTFVNSLVEQSGGSAAWDPAAGIDGGHNVDADPWLIENPGGALRPGVWSPCMNAGDNTAPDLPATDIDGDLRIRDGIVDMGAWETECYDPGSVVFVDADATGDGSGASWADASTELRITSGNACGSAEEVWVAEGTYKPVERYGQSATFQLVNGVAVYGGFAGDETNRLERNPGAHPTILSGEIGGTGQTDNCRHVVTGTGTDATAILDGFIIEDGFAVGGFPDDHGAGLINYPGSPTLNGVMFRNNWAMGGGGGMYNYIGSAPILTNVVFDGNTALSSWGGGIKNILADVTLLNATFSNNHANSSGGAISNQNGTMTITNSILWGNDPPAGQVFNLNNSPLVSHSLIQGSGGSGGGWDPSVGTDGGNNLDTDPMFVDAPGGNLRLNESSPAVNAGDGYAEGLPSTDIDGNPRIIGADVDMGAYETELTPTGIDNRTPVTATRLDNAWPNPFNPTVTITYQLKTEAKVTLSIYDVAGRLIKRLVDDTKSPGTHQSSWNGLDRTGKPASSGVYFVELRTGNGKVDHRKITLLK